MKKKKINKKALKIEERPLVDLPKIKFNINENSNDDRSLLEDFETQLTSNEPIRELFTSKNINFKTELTEEERGTISILYATYTHALRLGINLPALRDVLDQYIVFGVALGRKGRSEYVDAHKSQQLANQLQQNQQMQNQATQLKM